MLSSMYYRNIRNSVIFLKSISTFSSSHYPKYVNFKVLRKFSGSGTVDTFSGKIPTDKLEFRYTTSSGPGGQHVNKGMCSAGSFPAEVQVNSKVEIRFHLETADWIPKSIRQEMLTTLASKINKEGYLVISSEKTKMQTLNKSDCLEKLIRMIQDTGSALEIRNKKAVPSPLDIARQKSASERRVHDKRMHSLHLQAKRSNDFDEY